MKEPRQLNIEEKKEYTNGNISLSHLSDTGRCHIMTINYGEVTSTSLNKTEVKRVIKWLQNWVKFKDAEAHKSVGDEPGK